MNCSCCVLVRQGWIVHVPGERSISNRNRLKWKSIIFKIQSWIYSWMRPGYVEDEDEYKISKFFLLQFVCSAAVLRVADGNIYIIKCILKFLQGHVFVYEGLYLHYKRKNLRHFDTSHGTPHEVRC